MTRINDIYETGGEIPYREIHLAEYVQLCWRRRWIIGTLVVTFSGIAGLWSFMQVPMYQAKSVVEIDRYEQKMLPNGSQVGYTGFYLPEYYETHYKKMTSYPVLQETARRLGLFEKAKRQEIKLERRPIPESGLPSWLQGLVGVVGRWALGFEEETKTNTAQETGVLEADPSSGSSEDHPKDLSEDVKRKIAMGLSGQIAVQPEKDTQLVNVIGYSKNPKIAARLANTLADAYIDYNLDQKMNAARLTANWFTSHLDELRKKVEQSEEALHEYRVMHGLGNVSEQQNAAMQRITQLNSELVKAELKRSEAEARLEQIQAVNDAKGSASEYKWSQLNAVPQVLKSDVIQELRSKEIELSKDLRQLSDRYGQKHPAIIKTRTELEEIRSVIRGKVQEIYNSIEGEYALAHAQEQAIREALTKQKTKMQELDRHEVEYRILEKEANSNRHMYDLFLRQMKETDLSAEFKPSNISIVEHAFPPGRPFKPNHLQNIIMGLVVGGLVGLGLAFFLEYWDRSIRTEDDLKRYLPGMTVLGKVPRQAQKKNYHLGRLIHDDPLSPASDGIRAIRTSLLFSMPDHHPRVLLVTSPGKGEGKTTVASNLAIAMSHLEDARVLLIDADLRRPSLQEVFSIRIKEERTKGLAHYLVGSAEFDDIIFETDLPFVTLIPYGATPPNPAELFHSKRMTELIQHARQSGYQVIIDSPPLLATPDATILVRQVEGTILVVSAGETDREAAKAALERINSVGGTLLGIVIQKAQVEHFPYYYGYYHTKYSASPSQDMPLDAPQKT